MSISVPEADRVRGGLPPCGERCPMCGSPAPAVFVHGHLQCAACGTNIDPCCSGAPPVSDAGVVDTRT